jgi:hypothetical protein
MEKARNRGQWRRIVEEVKAKRREEEEELLKLVSIR